MGLLDFGAKVLLSVKADTSQAKAEIKSLAGEEKKLAEAQLSSANARNAQLDGQLKGLGNLAIKAAAAGVAIHAAFAAAEHVGRKADLSAAAGSVSIEGLRKATFGLRTDMQLLETAAKLNHSVFKLNQGQMEIAAKAMTALGERGGDAEGAINAVTDALVTGKTKGLREFGIEVDETKNKSEKLKSIMEQLARVSGEVSEATLDGSDALAQQKVRFQNSFDTIKEGLGAIVVALEPLVSALATVTGIIANGLGDAIGVLSLAAGGGDAFLNKYGMGRDKQTGEIYANDAASVYFEQHGGTAFNWGLSKGKMAYRQKQGDEFVGALSGGLGDLGSWAGDYAGKWTGGPPVGRGRGKGAKADRFAGYSDFQGFDTDKLVAPVEDSASKAAKSVAELQALFAAAAKEAGTTAEQAERLKLANEDSQSALAEYYRIQEAAQQAKTKSAVESVFGTIDQINETDMAISALGTTWSGLSDAVVAGYDAMVSGSGSFWDAVRKSVAGSIKAAGSEMAVLAIKETGLGFASLALGPLGGVSAGTHFKAAAVFAGGAVLAGVAANALGNSGGGSSAAAAGARSYASGGGSSSDGGKAEATRIFIYADAFADDSERGKRATAEKMVKRAYGSGAVENN